MVQKYPPDWNQARYWPRPGGGFWAAVPLGTDQPVVTRSHPNITVVRTLVAELDAAGDAVGGQLVEFIGETGVDPGAFDDLVREWLDGGFGHREVLVAEYNIAYAAEQAMLYDPADSTLTLVGLSLQHRSPLGKAQADEEYCWVTDVIRERFICLEINGHETCRVIPAEIEITCVETDSDGGGDGGDDGDGSGSPSFTLLCEPASPRRGQTTTCSVTVSGDPEHDMTQYRYNWTSSLGATYSDAATRAGTATEDAEISVVIEKHGALDPFKVSVQDRSPGWAFETLYAELGYTREPKQKPGRYGFYEELTPTLPQYDHLDSGPWSGQALVSEPPKSRQGKLNVSEDFVPGSSLSYNLNGLPNCVPTPVGPKVTYPQVNSPCGTLDDISKFKAAVEAHERYHEKGYSDCLTGATGQSFLRAFENLHGPGNEVIAAGTALWNEFIPRYKKAGKGGTSINTGNFWRYLSGWTNANVAAGGELGNHGC
ncbi:MAG: hypothetical protein OXU68_09175 [Bacteroidota bacterium]|nr:hypothetical protein [Bacteroidota bacterium]